MKVNIWNIEGYCGFNDWDSPNDNNIHKELAFDASFQKETIEKIFFELNKQYRNVVLIKCDIVKMIQL